MSDFERIVYKDPDKGYQIRLTVNNFQGKDYLHFRKYYLDFEGEYLPTKEGFSFPFDIEPSFRLFLALSELLSDAETEAANEALIEIVKTYNEHIPEPRNVP